MDRRVKIEIEKIKPCRKKKLIFKKACVCYSKEKVGDEDWQVMNVRKEIVVRYSFTRLPNGTWEKQTSKIKGVKRWKK